MAMQHDLESWMIKSHLRNHGVFEVAQMLLPIRPDPGELLVNPDPKATEATKNMIFLANMRVEQLPQGVLSIKKDQESAVTDGYVSGHDDFSRVKDRSKKSTTHALYLMEAMPCNGNFSLDGQELFNEICADSRHPFFANGEGILNLLATADMLW
jgi:hypothetical protein